MSIQASGVILGTNIANAVQAYGIVAGIPITNFQLSEIWITISREINTYYKDNGTCLPGTFTTPSGAVSGVGDFD